MRLLRGLLGIAGLAFLGVALATTSGRARSAMVPSVSRWCIAGALTTAGLWLSARVWASLLEGQALVRSSVAGFVMSQPAKYIPGAIWQPVGQVVYATGAGVSLGAASAALGTQILTAVSAAGAVGSLLALVGTHLRGVLRVLPLFGLLPTLVLFSQRARRGALWMLTRATHRSDIDPGLLPPRAAIVRAYLWCLGSSALTAGAYAILLSSQSRGHQILTSAACAFALSWVVGFLAAPVPGGIGVREAVLVGILGPFGAAPVIAASIVHRLVSIIGELLSVSVVKLGRWR